MIKAGSTSIHDGSSSQVLLQSRRDHTRFYFLKGDQKATARKSVYGDSTTEKVLPTVKKAGVSQMRGSWTGTRDANGEFQEDGGAQHIMLC